MLNIKSKENSIIKNILKLNKSSKYRAEQNLFLAEGVRLCNDAYLSGVKIVKLIVSSSALEKYNILIKKIEDAADNSYLVDDRIFSMLSDTKTPQGVLCVIETLDKNTMFDKINCNGKILALENIQDPNNMGTILRTADALGIQGIVLTEDCCDIYNSKVVRGSMGAIFRIPVYVYSDICSFIKKFNKNGESYAAVLDNSSKRINDIEFNKNSLMVIGNEGHGLTEKTIECCSQKVIIPMSNNAESLNAAVAASIFMWEMIK